MTMRAAVCAAVVCAVVACGGGNGRANGDASTADVAMRDGTADGAADASAGDGGAGCVAVPRPDFRAALDATERTIAPRDVDARTTLLPDSLHKVWVPRAPSRPQLFVMLPGTDGRPANNSNLLRIAARAGFRTIGLAYPNDVSGQELCTGGSADCDARVHVETLYGRDVVSNLSVDAYNSIEYRLASLLRVLHQRFGAEGWGAYLDGERVRWDQVVLAGFSQGSGHAGYLAKDTLVARVIFFSSGGDITADAMGHPVPVPWCFEARATPPERTFGLLHLEDSFDAKRVVYAAFGMDRFGDFSRADLASPPHTCSHQLSTGLMWNPGTSAHLSLASDNAMPVDGAGVPVLAEDYFDLMTRGL